MQIKDHLPIIAKTLSGQNAHACAAALSGYNRVPLSRGYDEAAACCAGWLQSAGIESRVLSLPLERGRRYWTQPGFDAWTCQTAQLRLTAPVEEVLCDYRECPMSLVQRSAAADLPDAPLILLDRGSDPEVYGGLDLRGAVVFAPEAPYEDYRWAVTRRGALGLVTDYMPETFTKDRTLLPDARSYFSFYWREEETPFFAFVLTPRQGDALRALCRQMEADWRQNGTPRYPRCQVQIQTETAPGCAQVVEAFLPGETEEEIVLTAHLCHPQPCANDNASGCAGAMEALRTLAALVRSGALPPLRRGIRLLLVPEVSGTFAYLSAHEEGIRRMTAAINLDMIGRRQEGRSGMLGIWTTPDALPSCGIDVMAYIRSLSDREAPTFNIGGRTTPFHSRLMEYNGGSDHYVYCDPTVGVPCITLMQWMDKNYHTSSDRPENLDPEMLHKSASLAACWVYALAAPDPADLPHVFAHMRLRFLETLRQTAEGRPAEGIGLDELYAYETGVFCQAAGGAARLYGPAVRPLAPEQARRLETLAELERPGCLHERPALPGGDRRVPRRLVRGPVSTVGSTLGAEAERDIQALSRQYPGLYGYHSVDHFILFRVDGKRTVSEIARLVGLESRYYSEGYVAGYLTVLARCGLVAFDG